MKVLAFAASSSQSSINKRLVTYATSTFLKGATVEVLDLNDYELPLFSEDREIELGQPELAKAFMAKIASADALVISFAEHNGSYTAAYKNLFDWCSRINPKVYQGKPVVMLATSPGKRGASSVLAAATSSAPFFNADLKASLSIPSFNENFDVDRSVLTNDTLVEQMESTMKALL